MKGSQRSTMTFHQTQQTPGQILGLADVIVLELLRRQLLVRGNFDQLVGSADRHGGSLSFISWRAIIRRSLKPSKTLRAIMRRSRSFRAIMRRSLFTLNNKS